MHRNETDTDLLVNSNLQNLNIKLSECPFNITDKPVITLHSVFSFTLRPEGTKFRKKDSQNEQ